jgi:hypothetical protein
VPTDRRGQAWPTESLYPKLGGVFTVAAVIDDFDAVVQNPVEGRPPQNAALGTGTPVIRADGRV